MSKSAQIGVVAIAVTASLFGVLQWQARAVPATVGFWFGDDVTFAVHDERRLGGAISADEAQQIRTLARAQIERAFQPFGIAVTDQDDAPFRVEVRQAIRPHRWSAARYTGAAGESYVLGPLGNYGRVNFQLLAAQAMSYAPAGTSRADIIAGIGRGIGHAAIHELTHQLLPRVRIDAADDESSYEFGGANRRLQYYGELHWTLAQPKLRERFAAH